MSDSVYDMFCDLAQLGMAATLYLRSDGDLREKHGVISRISPKGVLIQNSKESTFVSADSLVNFTLAQAGGHVTADTAPQAVMRDDRPEDESPPQPETLAAKASEGAKEEIDEAQFDIFASPIQVLSLRPDFSISDLAEDDRAELIRWKNRYEYAVKVSEMARVIDDVRPIGRLAERLRHPDLYLLAGSIAVAAKAYDLAEPQLINAIALGSVRGAVAMTWLALAKNDIDKAVEMACRAVTLETSAFGGQDDSILLLGRLLARLSEKDVVGITEFAAQLAGTEFESLGNTLIGFALKQNYPVAAKAALAGQVAEAKRLAPAARAFQSLPPLSVGSLQKPSPILETNKSATKIEEFGRITAAYPEKACGFLINEVTGETLFYAFAFITDPDLLEAVEFGLVGHKVHFTVRPIVRSIKAKYDQARSIRLRPNQSGSLIRSHSAKGLSQRSFASQRRESLR